MRILLVTLHVRPSDQAVPLAAANLKAVLPENLQQDTELVNLFPGETTAARCRQLLQSEPQIIAFSLYAWNRLEVLALSRLLKQHQSGLILLAGGPEASADSKAILTEGNLDGVARGEGEAVFADLVNAFVSGKKPVSIPGYLSVDHQDSNLAETAATCPELADLPSPWLSGQLPLERHCGVLWEVARGCRFNCAFCYDAKGHRGVRMFPLERLQKELELFAAKNVSQVWILDSTFNAPPERGRALLEMLRSTAPGIHYHLEAKADFLDDATIRLLAELSCSVQIGLQSAKPEILAPLHRKLDLRQMEKRLDKLSRYGITFGLDLIYGLPGDNHSGFRESIDFALRQRPNQLDIFPLAILPGTDLHIRQEKFAVKGMSAPPYLLVENRSYPQQDLQQSRLLAAAADIFYNRGRAVGFFLPLCSAAKSSPSAWLEEFAAWLELEQGIAREELLDCDAWLPDRIRPLQLSFCARVLKKNGQPALVRLAEDLINYHFLCAEALLGDDCVPIDQPCLDGSLRRKWRLNPAVRLHRFHYSGEDIEEAGFANLQQLAKRLRPEPGHMIFLRQNGQVVIEQLDDEFVRFLQAAKQVRTTSQLLGMLAPDAAEELFSFAVEQGLLLRAT